MLLLILLLILILILLDVIIDEKASFNAMVNVSFTVIVISIEFFVNIVIVDVAVADDMTIDVPIDC
jgi:hypothetical protein